MKRGRPHWCVHPKCLGFETQGVYANVADRQTLKPELASPVGGIQIQVALLSRAAMAC